MGIYVSQISRSHLLPLPFSIYTHIYRVKTAETQIKLLGIINFCTMYEHYNHISVCSTLNRSGQDNIQIAFLFQAIVILIDKLHGQHSKSCELINFAGTIYGKHM